MKIKGFTPYPKDEARTYEKNRWWLGTTLGDMLQRAADFYPNKEALVEGQADAVSTCGAGSSPSETLRRDPDWLLLLDVRIGPNDKVRLRETLSGDFIDMASSGWPHYRNTLQVFYSTYHRLLTEPHRRWATGFSCLFFVWVGAPLAIQMRNSDLLASFALCFLPILIVYYPLLVFGVDGAKHGTIPPWSIWAGNVLLAGDAAGTASFLTGEGIYQALISGEEAANVIATTHPRTFRLAIVAILLLTC